MIEVLKLAQTLRRMGLARLRPGRDDLNLLLVCVCVRAPNAKQCDRDWFG